MNKTCLFCKISADHLPSEKHYEDDLVFAFSDIHPKAKVHILIVSKKHISSVAEMTEGDEGIIGHMVKIAKELAEKLNIASDGYRLVFNTRAHGGQAVDHIHLHLLGGQRLGTMV